MEPEDLFGAERGVMPVIAVVLMIAVTVILAAVVAGFALGMGGGAGSTPQASFDFDYDATAGNVTITHESGDALEETRVTVLVDGTPDSPSTDWGVTEISTGDSYVTGVSGGLAGGEEIRVRWEENGNGPRRSRCSSSRADGTLVGIRRFPSRDHATDAPVGPVSPTITTCLPPMERNRVDGQDCLRGGAPNQAYVSSRGGR